MPKGGTSRGAVNRRSSTDPLAAHGYTTQSPIAAGAFSMIVRALDNASGKPVAVKTFNKAKVQKDQSLWHNTCREISVLQHLNPTFHPHLANLIALHDNPISVHLVLEYCDGASLQRILQKLGVNIGMAESKVAELTRQLCSGLGHVHSQGIAHRDVKPSNVVFCSSSDGCEYVKMVDFGFAIRCGDERCYTKCGTPIYMAPEQNKSQPSYLGPPVDCWAREFSGPSNSVSFARWVVPFDALHARLTTRFTPLSAPPKLAVGAMLYEMLAGKPAFNGSGLGQIAQRIRTANHEPWNGRTPVTAEAKALVKRIFTCDASQRPSMVNIMDDPWFARHGAHA